MPGSLGEPNLSFVTESKLTILHNEHIPHPQKRGTIVSEEGFVSFFVFGSNLRVVRIAFETYHL